MKKTSRLLVLLLALSLLLTLSLPALAGEAEPAYREEFAATGGWPPELIGSWVDKDWQCKTFYPDGRYVVTGFQVEVSMSGSSRNYYVKSGDWILAYGGQGKFRKVSMPFARLITQEEVAAAGVDPEIIGIFGGTFDGVYAEWTFHGDGRYTRVIPYDEYKENGSFLSGNDSLAILLNGQIIRYEYKVGLDSLTISLPNNPSQTLQRRSGPLGQVPYQWKLETTELAVSAWQNEYAETGGWPPEAIGSWVGFYMSTWGCWTFYPDGRHVLTNFDRAGLSMIGTSKTLEPADEAIYESTAEGDFWHLSDYGQKGEFHKVSLPYVRLKAEEETAVGVDPGILGTFGGQADGKYIEWTFHSDGRMTQITPYLELAEHGTFLTGDGQLVILLSGKIIHCAYTAGKTSLSLTFSDASFMLQKRTGPLVQVPQEEWNMWVWD